MAYLGSACSIILLATVLPLCCLSPAMADDIPTPTPRGNTIAVEFTPEFDAKSGAFADGYVKTNLAHTFDSGLIWTGAFQFTDKVGGDRDYRTETTFGYHFKLNDIWTLPVSAGAGYLWDENPSTQPSQRFAYYVVNIGFNLRLSDQWTWNAVNARWRDAFEGGWQTPKIASGLTYNVDLHSSVYANIGYAWKNGQPDKISVTAGYKYAF